MKPIFLAIFSFISLIIQGQTIQYLDNYTEWKYHKSIGPCLEYGEYNYTIIGDTLINGKLYKKIYSKGFTQGYGGPGLSCLKYYNTFIDNTPSHFIRQENKKIYSYYPECSSEILLYNFNLKKNDSLKIYELPCDTTYYTTTIIDSIDSVLVGANYRKVFHFNLSCGMGGDATTIIEGIGNEHDLFQICNGEFEGNFLDCYGINSISLYSPSYESCILDLTVNNNDLPISNNEVLVYPNPANNQVSIKHYNRNQIINQIEVLNLTGQIQLKTKSINEIDISALQNGIYYLKFIFDDLSTTMTKIIKY